MSDRALIASLCLAEVLGMLGISAFAALLPMLQVEWSLSNADAGWINGIYFAGYMLAVPVLVALTDRVDARGIYLVATALSGIALLGFATLAGGFWTAMLFRGFSGIALAGTYMPGLKALADRLDGGVGARAVAFYTASFGIGVSSSFLLTGLLIDVVPWPWVFGLLAIGAPAAMLVAGRVLARRPAVEAPPSPRGHLLDFRPVFANRRALGYILAYTAHNWELFGVRGWLVAYLVWVQARQPGYAGWDATLIATVVSLLAVPASIIGGEIALRGHRRRVISVVMALSATLAVAVGFASGLPFPWLVALVLLHAPFIAMDSAAITTGAVAAAPPGGRGAVMAMHSFIGFAGAFTGPLAFGLVLDAAGPDSALGWGLAFASLAVGLLLGPLALAICGRKG